MNVEKMKKKSYVIAIAESRSKLIAIYFFTFEVFFVQPVTLCTYVLSNLKKFFYASSALQNLKRRILNVLNDFDDHHRKLREVRGFRFFLEITSSC